MITVAVQILTVSLIYSPGEMIDSITSNSTGKPLAIISNHLPDALSSLSEIAQKKIPDAIAMESIRDVFDRLKNRD